MPGKFDFEEQFCFYAAFHSNLTNILIHIPCVPMILFTALILSHYFTFANIALVNVPLHLPAAIGGYQLLQLTFPVLFVASYALYFIALEPVAGLLYAPILLTMGHLSNTLYLDNPSAALQYAGYGFIGAWIAQFVGHGKFEGRAPALLTSLFQSLVLAPFFIWMEILFFLGYRPELHRRLKNRTGKAIAEYRQEKAKAARVKAQ